MSVAASSLNRFTPDAFADFEQLRSAENSVKTPPRIAAALQALREGRAVALLDDDDRENEADLIYAAEKLDVEGMALMIPRVQRHRVPVPAGRRRARAASPAHGRRQRQQVRHGLHGIDRSTRRRDHRRVRRGPADDDSRRRLRMVRSRAIS